MFANAVRALLCSFVLTMVSVPVLASADASINTSGGLAMSSSVTKKEESKSQKKFQRKKISTPLKVFLIGILVIVFLGFCVIGNLAGEYSG